MQGRITPENCTEAYEAVGTARTRATWGTYLYDDGPWLFGVACLCPLLVVAEWRNRGAGLQALRLRDRRRDGDTDADNELAVMSFVAASAGVSQDYAWGFAWGVDGWALEAWMHAGAQALLGYQDGRAVAGALFDDHANLWRVPTGVEGRP